MTRPVSGSVRPVRMRSSVLLPSPLRPTTPMTSPLPRPRLTPASSVRVPYVMETRSALIRFTIGVRVRGLPAAHRLAGTFHLARIGGHRAFGQRHRRANRVEGSQPLLDVGNLVGLQHLRHFADVVGQLVQWHLALSVTHDYGADRNPVGNPLMLLDLAIEQLAYPASFTFTDEHQAPRAEGAVDHVAVAIGGDHRLGHP